MSVRPTISEIENAGYIIRRNGIIIGKRFKSPMKPAYDKDGYQVLTIRANNSKHLFRVHRLVAMKYLGLTDNMLVDHIDFNKANNNVENLRICTPTQNSRNSRNRRPLKNCSSKYKGVSFNQRENKWRAFIRDDSHNQIFLGYFDKEKEAATAYNEAAKKIHLEFAVLNEV